MNKYIPVTRSVLKALKEAKFENPYQMAKMFLGVYVSIEKCAELEAKLRVVRPGKIVKRRRSEYIPIQPAPKRQRSHSQGYVTGPHTFDDDEFNLTHDTTQEVSERKFILCLLAFKLFTFHLTERIQIQS